MIAAILIFATILFLIIKTAHSAIEDRTPTNIGKAGESEVSFALSTLPQEYLVINNLIIPDQETAANRKCTTQIDHVVVSPYGVFVIETKNYSGWIFGSEKSKRWKETFKTTEGIYFYNPIKQNWGHTYALAELLDMDIRFFKPIVVFSNNCRLNVESSTPVVHISQLKGLILSCKQEIMPRPNVERVFNRLCEINLTGEAVESRHNQSIGIRLTEKEMTMQEGKCPLCGGELKLRNGKYGPFYGCSNYPRCRFTQKASI